MLFRFFDHGYVMSAIGGHENADGAIDDAVDLFARRRGFHRAEKAQLEEAAADQIEELADRKLEIVGNEPAFRNMRFKEAMQDGAQVLRPGEEVATQARHAFAHAEHDAHRGHHLLIRHMGEEGDAEGIKAFPDILMAGQDRADRGEKRRPFAFHHGNEKVFLVFEVDVDRAFGDARLAGDVVHARRIEAHLHEDAFGTFQNLFALGRIGASCKASARARVPLGDVLSGRLPGGGDY